MESPADCESVLSSGAAQRALIFLLVHQWESNMSILETDLVSRQPINRGARYDVDGLADVADDPRSGRPLVALGHREVVYAILDVDSEEMRCHPGEFAAERYTSGDRNDPQGPGTGGSDSNTYEDERCSSQRFGAWDRRSRRTRSRSSSPEELRGRSRWSRRKLPSRFSRNIYRRASKTGHQSI